MRILPIGNATRMHLSFPQFFLVPLNITTSGNVFIGKTSQINTGYILDVNGNGQLNEVVVSNDWNVPKNNRKTQLFI